MNNLLKKFICAALVLAMTLTGIGPGIFQAKEVQASSYINPQATNSDYIILGTYYISKDNVKSMAATMRAMTSPTATILEGLLGLTSPAATLTMIAVALSASAASKTEVLYAADHNMRVKVVVKDAPVHTSYSTIVEFTAVY